jgi:hypothetical protein
VEDVLLTVKANCRTLHANYLGAESVLSSQVAKRVL